MEEVSEAAAQEEVAEVEGARVEEATEVAVSAVAATVTEVRAEGPEAVVVPEADPAEARARCT